MALIPWKHKNEDREGRSLAPAEGFRHEMDRMFENFLRSPFGWGEAEFGMDAWRPSLDVQETEKEVVVRAEVPGVQPEDLELSVSGTTLILSGQKREDKEEKHEGFYRRERHFGSFRRDIPLPSSVDANNVTADYAHGVVTVKLQKSPSAQAKRIPVKSA